MAIYRQIQTTYWQDKFILTLTPEEKFFYIYLLTNSKTKQCGIYELPIKIIELETGYNRETVIKLLQKFIEYERIRYDWEFEEIALKNWIKHNNFVANEKIQKCVENELKSVKNETFIDFMNFPDTLYIGYHNKNKNKNKNNNDNKKNNIVIEDELFNIFWDSYNKKVGKPNAIKEWNKLTEDEKDKIFQILPYYINSKPDKKFRKDPERFLKNKTFNDEIIEVKSGANSKDNGASPNELATIVARHYEQNRD